MQFSVLKGLAWLKTVSDVQKGFFVAIKGRWPQQYKAMPWISSCWYITVILAFIYYSCSKNLQAQNICCWVFLVFHRL